MKKRQALTDQLLWILSDGQFHSGEQLAQTQSVTRTTIWKHIKRIQSMGIEIHAVNGKGYRIPGGIARLDTDFLQSLSLTLHSQSAELVVLNECDSTNAYCARYCKQRLNYSPLWCLAEYQNVGRGRRGRQWHSPYAKNLYCSFVYQHHHGSSALSGLSLAIGLSLAQGLECAGLSGLSLKWPNDLLCGDKKIAGILVEINGDWQGLCDVIIGFGVNVDMKPHLAQDHILQPFTDCASQPGFNMQRTQLAGQLMQRVLKAIETYTAYGLRSFRDDWHKKDYLYGQAVIVSQASGQIEGVAKGIDELGRLIVEQANGKILKLHCGEVSVRRRTLLSA